MKNIKKLLCLTFAISMLCGCATESHKSLQIQHVASYNTVYHGKRTGLVVGKFHNRSSYMNGVFADNDDRLGNQAKSILITHLQQTNRFNVMDRSNMEELQEEARLKGKEQNLKGASYLVTGSIAEFGRKQIGDQQLFGIIGRGKSQIAYAKVNLNIVKVATSEVVHSVQGAGEYKLSDREIIGFGGTSSYDSTLNGKVLDLAMREAVNQLIGSISNSTSFGA